MSKTDKIQRDDGSRSSPVCRLGITGGLACGKSEVGRLLQEQGVPVLDTDAVAHEVMAEEPGVREVLKTEFGENIYKPNGELDRAQLAQLVFADSGRMQKLNAIVHPEVHRRWRSWLSQQADPSMRVAAVIIPLLYESGVEEDFDNIWVVSAAEAVVLQRLAQRGISPEDAARRLAAQWPLAEKEKRADQVVENNQDINTLGLRIETLLKNLL